MKRFPLVLFAALLSLLSCGKAGTGAGSGGRPAQKPLEWETTAEKAPVVYTEYYLQMQERLYSGSPGAEMDPIEALGEVFPDLSVVPDTGNGGAGYAVVEIDPESWDGESGLPLYLRVPAGGEDFELAASGRTARPGYVYQVFHEEGGYIKPIIRNKQLVGLEQRIVLEDGKEVHVWGELDDMCKMINILASETSEENPMYIVSDGVRSFFIVGGTAYAPKAWYPNPDHLGGFQLPEGDYEIIIWK